MSLLWAIVRSQPISLRHSRFLRHNCMPYFFVAKINHSREKPKKKGSLLDCFTYQNLAK
ncbi:phage tail assembly chaperone GT [Bacteroides uniformis]|uniref:phage tail assembly chaperone GT n=1 Tax=Bacteroides uniformis TaxID=820 RepID=UPI0036F30D9A